MTDSIKRSTIPDPLQRQIEKSADAVDLSKWYPARAGIVPEFRVGQRWFSSLWLIPIGLIGIVAVLGIAQEVYDVPIVQRFVMQYPGHVTITSHFNGFPLWLRIQHLLNLFLMMFIIRSGIQILADFPRLYLDRNCTPGKEWFRFQKPVPTDRVWTSRDDAVTIPGWLGLTGIRHSIGLARWWHFSCDVIWLLNGLIFYILLFATGQWERLIPRTWEVLPNALSCALQYASLHMPAENGWVRYNSLQQIAYFVTVFIAAPLATVSGIMQSPAVSNRAGWLGKVFNRQIARTIHFFVLLWFLQFIVIHVTMVFITGFRRNFNHIALGTDTTSWTGTIIAAGVAIVFVALWYTATPFTIKHSRLVQHIGRAIVGPIMGAMEIWSPNTRYEDKDIAPYLWPNGMEPDSDEYKQLCKNNFADYKLRISGLVSDATEFSYDQLKEMPKQEQVTNHFCIQGWSGVAKWGGVRMTTIMDKVKPLPEAKFVLFYSYGGGSDGGFYWDAHRIENMRHDMTILAYELNGKPLPVLHGAPLRLRCENELGFKMVKWIRAIEFVSEFKSIGSGQGGYAEDHEFFAYRDPI